MSPSPARALLRRLDTRNVVVTPDMHIVQHDGASQELGREHHVPMPADDVDALREFMVVRDAQNL